MTTKEYLPVSRPNEKYCLGCPAYVFKQDNVYCSALVETIIKHKQSTNCPLVKIEEKQLISCEDKEPNPFCFCPRCDAERQRIGQIIAKHMESKE